MLDLKRLRTDTDAVRAALARRGAQVARGVDVVLALDERRRELIPETESLKAEQNVAGAAIAAARKAGDDASAARAAMGDVKARGQALGEELATVQAQLQSALAKLPNLPDPTAADADTVLREEGTIPSFAFVPRDHQDLAGERIDLQRGARLAGSRFAYLKGDLVFLELALVRWCLDKLHGYGFTAVIPPVLAREQALYGTGFLPDTEQQIYHLPADDLYLLGTSEVALASLHAGEILDEGQLPVLYAGLSPCFRREAGAAGRDSRGIFRVHQFDKVEMFAFVRPEDSVAWHDRLLSIEEEILTELGLPYRVVNIAVDDLGASAAKKYDCEAWLPGQDQYRELTSTSNTTDFQARRLQIRYRPAGAGKPRTPHTLNGTAVAVGRTIVALLENGQREDGSVVLPAALRAYGMPDLLPAAG